MCRELGDLRTSALRRRRSGPSRSGRDGTIRRVLNRKRSLNPAGQNRAQYALFGQGEVLCGFPGVIRHGSLWRGMFSPREARVEREKRRGITVLRVLRGGRVTPPVFRAKDCVGKWFDQLFTFLTIDTMTRDSQKHEKYELRVVCIA
ncbi:hypothetical protein Taro_009036 [Colocasia esculenta]|uniref:Uncharacterized protein n=1 Tax=Colocasia esculenta TaxID=4460 RepID=A0A843TVD0_COLES|nr:hypothetical protein [Colocasia esculenta]